MLLTDRWRHWVASVFASRSKRVLARRAVPEALWQRVVRTYPFVAARPPDELARLRSLVSHFLDHKEFHAVAPLALTDEIALCVAVQACLPVLNLGLENYDGFVGIVMHQGAVTAAREEVDETGVVHAYNEELSGEAMEGGPLMLSWEDVQMASAASDEPAYNVVIHEFAHVLDMRDGAPDGVPLLPSQALREQWQQVLQAEFDSFCERVVCGHDTTVDPYGAESIDEFFAVASEAFFVAPRALQQEQPAMYRLLASYYRQDPAAY
jgi:MtfA peptidase